MHFLAFGINFLPHSVNLILIILFLTILLALLPHHHHFHCPSLLLFSTLNSKDTFFSEIVPAIDPTPFIGLPLRILVCSMALFLVFPLTL